MSSSHLASSHLVLSHLMACSPGRRRIPQSSGVAPSGPGLLAGGTCRSRRSWARKAGPPCVPHTEQRARSSRGWGKKTLGSGSALSLRKCQAAGIKISTTTEALFSFHSQHKCFGKVIMLKIAPAASADARETAGVLPSRWLEAESS